MNKAELGFFSILSIVLFFGLSYLSVEDTNYAQKGLDVILAVISGIMSILYCYMIILDRINKNG